MLKLNSNAICVDLSIFIGEIMLVLATLIMTLFLAVPSAQGRVIAQNDEVVVDHKGDLSVEPAGQAGKIKHERKEAAPKRARPAGHSGQPQPRVHNIKSERLPAPPQVTGIVTNQGVQPVPPADYSGKKEFEKRKGPRP